MSFSRHFGSFTFGYRLYFGNKNSKHFNENNTYEKNVIDKTSSQVCRTNIFPQKIKFE